MSSATGLNAYKEPSGFDIKDAGIWQTVRSGASFQYNIPVANGTYAVTLGFLEPSNLIAIGGRILSVAANGGGATITPITGLDVLASAGTFRTAYVAPTFNVTVTNGVLNLTFTGNKGEAVVSNIKLVKQ